MITLDLEETTVGPVQDLHLKAKEPEVGLELHREGHHGPIVGDLDGGHPGRAVDVSLDDVPTESTVDARRTFEVDTTTRR